MKRNERVQFSLSCIFALALAMGISVVSLSPITFRGGDMAYNSTNTPWGEIQVVSIEGSDNSRLPSLAVDAGGNVHVAWQDYSDYNGSGYEWNIFYKQWNAMTAMWTSTEVVSTESYDHARYPSLAVDRYGNVHVAWYDFSDILGAGADADIFYKKRDPKTGTWTATEVVSTESTSSSFHPSLAVDGSGTVHVAWDDETPLFGSGTDSDIFYKRKPLGGVWSATEIVSNQSSDNAVYPSLAVDINGSVHVAWYDYTNFAGSDIDICYKQKPVGGTWPTVTEVISTESTSDSMHPSIAVDSVGNVHIAWEDATDYADAGQDKDIFYKQKRSEAVWPAVTDVISVDNTGDSMAPSLAVDADCNIHVAWYDTMNYGGSGTDDDIFYMCFPRAPATPVLNSITPSSSKTGTINLYWVASDAATWYYVYRATSPIASTTALQPIAVLSGTFFQDEVTSDGMWYYAIVAANAFSNSTPSNCESVEVSISSGMIPENTYYITVGGMAGIAVAALIVGSVLGKRSIKAPRT